MSQTNPSQIAGKEPKTPSQIWKDIKKAGKIAKSESGASIYRVPEVLRTQNKNVYTPWLVSIGPLHSKDERLKSGIKNHYVAQFLQRMENATNKKKEETIKDCLDQVAKLIEDTKKSYAENVDDALTDEMMLIDGCFILELLYCYHQSYRNNNGESNSNKSSGGGSNGCFILELLYCYRDPPADDDQKINVESNSNKSSGGGDTVDPIFGSSQTMFGVRHDLLLLENQLPFFVLETLFSITLAQILPENSCRSLTHFVLLYFGDVFGVCNLEKCCDDSVTINVDVGGGAKPKESFHHLLHVVHNRYLPPEEFHSKTKMKEELIMRSASDLEFGGVKFEARSEGPLLKAKFHKPEGFFRWWSRASLEIPALHVTDATEPFLRNLIAFEHCCPEIKNYFTWYAVLMDKLIDSGDDVKVLERDKVLRIDLGDHKEAADLFNKLCKEVVLWEIYFPVDCKLAVDHSRKGFRKFVAHLRRRWFRGPWTVFAFFIAALSVTISVIQFARSFH